MQPNMVQGKVKGRLADSGVSLVEASRASTACGVPTYNFYEPLAENRLALVTPMQRYEDKGRLAESSAR